MKNLIFALNLMSEFESEQTQNDIIIHLSYSEDKKI
jgi:hypothetical protein